MIKFSMFFYQPFEVNICSNKMTFYTKNGTRQQGLKFKFTLKFINADKNNNNKTNNQIQKSII